MTVGVMIEKALDTAAWAERSGYLAGDLAVCSFSHESESGTARRTMQARTESHSPLGFYSRPKSQGEARSTNDDR